MVVMKLKVLFAILGFLFFSGAAFGAERSAYVDLKQALNDSKAGAKAKDILSIASKKEDMSSFDNLRSKMERFVMGELVETLAKIVSREKYSTVYALLQDGKYQNMVSSSIVDNFPRESAVDLTPKLIKEFNERFDVTAALLYVSPYLSTEEIDNKKKEAAKNLKEAAEKTVEANEAYYKGDFQGALNKHREAFLRREKNNDKFTMATSAVNVAANFTRLRDYQAAKEWATRAKELAEASNNNFVLGSSISVLADLEVMDGEFKEAIVGYKKAIELFEDSKDTYTKIKDSFTDEELLAKYNSSRKQINDLMDNLVLHKLSSVLALGTASVYSGDYDASLKYLKEFSDSNDFSSFPSILRESYKMTYEATLSYAEGCESEAQGDYENALLKFTQAQELYFKGMMKVDNAVGVALSMKKIGDIYLKLNREAEASSYYKQALEFSQENAPALAKDMVYKK